MDFAIPALILLAIIFLKVIVHEFGHFIAAKKSGVKVNEFAFGFPPRLYRKKIGETTYSVNLILLGGFVRLHGEENSTETVKDKRAFSSKPAHIKIYILLAGVFLNLVLGWFLLFSGYFFGMKPIFPGMADYKGVVNTMSVNIKSVESESPAEKEGLKQGDVIKKIEGKSVNTTDDVLIFVNEKVKTENTNNININLGIERNGEIQNKDISTYVAKEKVGKREVERPRMGIVMEDKGNVKAPFFAALKASFLETLKFMGLTLEALYNFFKTIFLKFQVGEEVSSPIGIFYAVRYFQTDFSAIIQLTALLGISIGLLNVLPIPGLDGGHVLTVLAEVVTKRKFSNKMKNIVQLIGFGFLILLFIVVIFKDLFKFGII